MIIQFILTGILLVTLIFSLAGREKAPFTAMCMIFLSLMGIVLVIDPAIAQVLATKVGIARGVDLIMYLFMAVMLIVIMDIYIRLQVMREMVTSVVRQLSLLEAQLKDHDAPKP